MHRSHLENMAGKPETQLNEAGSQIFIFLNTYFMPDDILL